TGLFDLHLRHTAIGANQYIQQHCPLLAQTPRQAGVGGAWVVQVSCVFWRSQGRARFIRSLGQRWSRWGRLTFLRHGFFHHRGLFNHRLWEWLRLYWFRFFGLRFWLRLGFDLGL